jgi:hypothetical protein
MSAATVQCVPDSSPHRQAELAWIATCARHEHRRRDQHGRGVNRIGRLTLESMDRCIEAGRVNPWQIATLAKHGRCGLPDDASPLERAEWHAAIDALEFEMVKPTSQFFYGTGGTPFVDAAEAWFWTLDCRDALEEGARCGGLRAGRPCDPDDVVNAMSRLQLPPIHARNVVAWGKKRTAPPDGSDARRLWDEAMGRLTVVLRAKGIVRSPGPSVFALMDLPLLYLASIAGEPLPSGLDEEPEGGGPAWSVAAE